MSPQQTIAHYRITIKLGEGGMGEVWRATDSKLNREVAIKILPEAFANDPDRLARFTREAQVLGSLNHPNIAAIYGVEERALVMELVEGPTLAERIVAGPIPLDEALSLAKQIAEALDYAHERGIMHRDLKPANIKITPEDRVKVLDFGLAKALASEPSTNNPASSPTLTMRATGAGVIMGTAAYMSPEQAKGKAVDKRADIWAFGLVLAEMLTGRQLYTGETFSEVLAAVLLKEPNLAALPTDTPAGIRRLLRRSLEKDPRRRLRDIGDVRLEIEDAIAEPSQAVAPAMKRPPSLLYPVPILLLAALAIWGWLGSPASPPSRAVMRWSVPLPNVLATMAQIALSPDGAQFAYEVIGPGGPGIFVRPLNQTESKFLAPAGPNSPFFSPDGGWLVFHSFPDRLQKIPSAGGPAVTLGRVISYAGGAWGPDDTIIIGGAHDRLGLSRIPSKGGTLETLTTPDTRRGEGVHAWPWFLPGGKTVLFTATTVGGRFDEGRIMALDLRTREQRLVLEGGTNARYVPTGHLIFAHAGSLLAVPFDPVHLAVKGTPVTVLENVASNQVSGFSAYAFSNSGTLLYLPGVAAEKSRMVWVDQKGAVSPLPIPELAYAMPSLSPDGHRAAMSIAQNTDFDIWISDLARGTLTPLTFGGTNYAPLWTADGKRVVFRNSSQSGKTGIFWASADGSGSPEQLLATDGPVTPMSWASDSSALLFYQGLPPAVGIWVLTSPGSGAMEQKPRLLFASPSRVTNIRPQLSPDGKWVAYDSTETGVRQVYIRPFPGPGPKVPISSAGGESARWARNGRQLYREGDKMMVVDVETSPEFRAGTPKMLFDWPYDRLSLTMQPGTGYDVSLDGERFLMIQRSGEKPATAQLQVVQDWFEELKQRDPPPNEKGSGPQLRT